VFDLPGGKTTIALKVAGLDRPGVLQQYLDMGKAHNWAQFEKALKRVQAPMFNIVYADRAGHILYLDNGILPKHPQGGSYADWTRPVAGDTSATLWKDVHPYEDLPKVLDPASGFVQNANDPPWLATYPRVLDPKQWPSYVSAIGPMSQRAQMSVKLLSEGPKLSFDDFVARKLTTRSLMADRMLPDLLAAAKDSTDADVQAAVAVLSAWDHQDNADSRARCCLKPGRGCLRRAISHPRPITR
jgi:acyl-homoserine-lactone acylase